MTDKLIERIETYRAAGTQGNFEVFSIDHGGSGYTVAVHVAGDESHPFIDWAGFDFRSKCEGFENALADACRAGLIPEMETRILADAEIIKAAEELAEAVDHERNMPCQDIAMQMKTSQAVDDALTAYRAAVSERDG